MHECLWWQAASKERLFSRRAAQQSSCCEDRNIMLKKHAISFLTTVHVWCHTKRFNFQKQKLELLYMDRRHNAKHGNSSEQRRTQISRVLQKRIKWRTWRSVSWRKSDRVICLPSAANSVVTHRIKRGGALRRTDRICHGVHRFCPGTKFSDQIDIAVLKAQLVSQFFAHQKPNYHRDNKCIASDWFCEQRKEKRRSFVQITLDAFLNNICQGWAQTHNEGPREAVGLHFLRSLRVCKCSGVFGGVCELGESPARV